MTTIADAAGTIRGASRTRRLELPILAIPGLAHAFTLKGTDPGVAISEAASGRALPLRSLRQVHGAVVRVIEDDPWSFGSAPPEGDALVTATVGTALAVWVADCVPILIADPRRRALAAVHAGWRGTAAGVTGAAIRALAARFRSDPADLRVAVGPSIARCCFEVGPEVVDALLERDPGAARHAPAGTRARVDLVEANRRQALQAGVPAAGIAAAGLCTLCRGDLFHSFRRDGPGAGRMAGIIAWSG